MGQTIIQGEAHIWRCAHGVSEVDSALRDDWDEHPIVRGSTGIDRATVDLIPVTDEASDSALLGAPVQREQKRGLDTVV